MTGSLHTPAGFEHRVKELPATTLHEQWGGLVAKVGDKVYALIGLESGDIVFKVEELSFDMLTSLNGVRQAPYFAKRRWVRVEPAGELGEDDVAAYVGRSYELIRDTLTKKRRAELGL